MDWFIARSIKWCDILGAHGESIFPFIQYFFLSRKQCFLRSPCFLLIAESISLDTSGKPTVGLFLKISFSYWIILSILLNELNSSDWLLKRWWKNFYMAKSIRGFLENLTDSFLNIVVNVNFLGDLKFEYICTTLKYCYK